MPANNRRKAALQAELDSIRAGRADRSLSAHLSLIDAWAHRAHRAGFNARYDFA